ncbi:MAG: hypothetical protein R6V19_02660 [Armatimonadota bacterium]
MHHRRARLLVSMVLIGLLCLACTQVFAREVQLAGIRLGDHAINLLDVYGQPEAVVVGPPIPVEQPEGGMMAEEMGGGPAGMPSDFMGMLGELTGMLGGPMGGMPDAAPPGEDIAAAAPGGGGAGGGGPGGIASNFPTYAVPVRAELQPYDSEWVYRKGPVVMGFVLDRDGFVKIIVIAAQECDYARTSLWKPHRYVKLGDSYDTVISRYGYPNRTRTFMSTGAGGAAAVGAGHATVSFGGSTRSGSRSCVLSYTRDNNIEFTLHDFRVTRIHIWED